MALTPEQAKAAAAWILSCWRDGSRLPAFPVALRPATRAEGYAVQAYLEDAGAGELMGWKIAATSAAGQAHIGVDGPLAGRLLADHAYLSGALLPWGHNTMRVAEAEFCFRMGKDFAPRATPYGTDEVLAGVATLHPAIEVPDSRFADFSAVGAAQLIADNACAHDFVLGAATSADWRSLGLSTHTVTGTVVGKLTRDGIGGNVLGDPRMALVWLVNELSAQGITLLAGHVVTTGTCLVPLPIAPGDHVTADFGVLGQVSARFGSP